MWRVGFAREYATAGIRELRNDVFAFEKAGERLYLCGVDDIWEKKNKLEARRSKKQEKQGAVLGRPGLGELDGCGVGIHHCFVIPALCYLYIAWYGVKWRAPVRTAPAG